eukprot:scaffold110063_cov17-Prasinocladus_malaysianus.AAC.2
MLRKQQPVFSFHRHKTSSGLGTMQYSPRLPAFRVFVARNAELVLHRIASGFPSTDDRCMTAIAQ